jgi:hypothetical protein
MRLLGVVRSVGWVGGVLGDEGVMLAPPPVPGVVVWAMETPAHAQASAAAAAAN